MQKTKILLVRHGQSEANVAGIFTGHSGYPLSKLGHEQAARTAEYIKKTYRVDAVYSSDLPRAFQTAEYTALAFGLPVTTDAQFREINGGDWERQTFEQLETLYPEEYLQWRADVGNACPVNGESVMELADRVFCGLQAVAEVNPGKCVVVATHATPVRAMIWKASGTPASEMQTLSWGGNCAVSEFDFLDGKLTAVLVNYVGHLAGIESKLPSNV